MKRIGTFEIMRLRVYNLDAESLGDGLRTTVIVEPGRYDLCQDDMTTFVMLHGQINAGGSWRLGDGLFALNYGDVPSGIEVTFPTKRWGPDEWAEMLAGPEFAEGSPDQRVRVHLDAEVA